MTDPDTTAVIYIAVLLCVLFALGATLGYLIGFSAGERHAWATIRGERRPS